VAPGAALGTGDRTAVPSESRTSGSFPKVGAYLTTYSTVPPSEVAAVRALFGEIPIRGRLPVTIPLAAPMPSSPVWR
jgi:hypothetical protein